MAMSPTPPSSAVPGAVVALGWDPEGTMVLAGGPGGQLTLWGDNGVMARGTCPPPQLWAVALLGAQCALVAAGRHLEEWELRGGRRLHRLRRHPALPRPIVGFCRGLRGGPVLILLGDGQLWLWDRGTPPKPLRAAVSPTPLDPKDLNRLYGADSGADGADGNGAAANGADGNGADDNGVAVTPYRLPGCPVAVQALPGGGFLLWGGMEKLHLCHLSRYGAAFRAAVTAVPLPPLPPHGPTQWFTGAEWHRGVPAGGAVGPIGGGAADGGAGRNRAGVAPEGRGAARPLPLLRPHHRHGAEATPLGPRRARIGCGRRSGAGLHPALGHAHRLKPRPLPKPRPPAPEATPTV
eukprot:XP_025001637.1 uncharacterized protein LOC112531022 isoform X2 [Gallus gallus]